jgi:two-component system alkaline phosphatase synthesis response regulator PhoP
VTSPTILVVDDEPAIRVLVRATLEPAGYRVVDAADGESALRAARTQRPHLVLLDVVLPGMSGLEVCRRLRAERATADAQILLLTGLEPADRNQAALLGAYGCIEKPFSPAGLLAHVAEALRPAAEFVS